MFYRAILSKFKKIGIIILQPQIKKIAILGSTGSIGKNALEVISQNLDKFQVTFLTTNSNVELLAEQSKIFNPIGVVILNQEIAKNSRHLFSDNVKIYSGELALNEIVTDDNIDLVLNSLVGFSGVLPTISAIKAKKNIALANKETLVAAGEIITSLAKENNVSIIPIDSEHSAILQCLVGEDINQIDNIYLTASGGPFLNFTNDQLNNVSISQALNHPNWSMGKKITIDSATLMNKGLEVIEAHWLFNLPANKIKILIHPQSIIHSMVEFSDGSIKAQLGLPDMKIPIQYALGFPNRIPSSFQRINFAQIKTLSFSDPDFVKFPNLQLAFDSLSAGGIIPAVLNAANEIAVEKFLNSQIKFLQISEIISKTISKFQNILKPTINQILESDYESRKIAKNIIF